MGGFGCRAQAIHQDGQQASRTVGVLGRAGHREEADEAGSDVLGRDVWGEFARRTAGREETVDGGKKSVSVPSKGSEHARNDC